jgi:cytochrome c553
MAAQAKNLSDQQIADLAAYYASVPGSLRDLQNAN